MTLTEKAAYLKGLKDGLNLDTEKAEGRLIDAIIEMLEDVALAVADLDDNAICVSDELDSISEELDAIEDCLDEDYFEDADEEEEDDDTDYDYEEYDFGDSDDVFYEITCPTCGEVITIDEDILEKGVYDCPSCGEELEFELDPEGDEEE